MSNVGSLINQIMDQDSNLTSSTPEVGMGATHILWTDRNAYTIIEVRTPRKLIVQRDKATRTDSHGMSASQSYEFEPDPEGEVKTIRLTKSGWKTKHGEKFVIGHRSEYYDYSYATP